MKGKDKVETKYTEKYIKEEIERVSGGVAYPFLVGHSLDLQKRYIEALIEILRLQNEEK